MDLGLAGKTAIVTGASRGIGLAIVESLVREGVTVVAASRQTGEALAKLAAAGRVRPFAVDLGQKEGPAQLAAFCLEELGRVDLLFNNVGGIDLKLGGFLEFSDEDWLRSFELNLLSVVRLTRAVLPAMLAQGSGAIVNISSINARQPDPVVGTYSAAKAGVTNLSKALAQEFGARGIRVNAVSPGPVRTAIQTEASGVAGVLGEKLGVARADLIEQLPKMNGMVLGRLVEPSEVAALALFLASPQAATITGEEILIDGGMSKTI
ncbi:MAG: SDR family oxidoreductase [Chloroflexi bacterium]|nr:SDR family oxidoreductase [Chloroflexota bacterium]OJV95124.1 MAG: hypothetical protein BGO39_24220 [Chloroflexi bacterium 54-19]